MFTYFLSQIYISLVSSTTALCTLSETHFSFFFFFFYLRTNTHKIRFTTAVVLCDECYSRCADSVLTTLAWGYHYTGGLVPTQDLWIRGWLRWPTFMVTLINLNGHIDSISPYCQYLCKSIIFSTSLIFFQLTPSASDDYYPKVK